MRGYWLRLRLASEEQRDFRVYDGAVVGRLPNCGVYLPHRSVSRRHAVVRVVDRQVRIEDSGSRNGTFINGTQIESGMLAPGDELRIGAIPLELIAETEATPMPDSGLAEVAAGIATADPDLPRDAVEREADRVTQLDGDDPGEVDLGPTEPTVVPAGEPRVEVRAPAEVPVQEPAEPGIQSHQRVLQYRKRRQRGLIATDLGQWSPLQRALALVAVLALAVGVFLAVATLTGSLRGN